jgi:Holliday junction DNA helicase RuvB
MPFPIERHFYLQPTLLYICVMNENLDPTNNNFNPEELDLEKKLRPLSFDDFTGQEQVLDNLKVLFKKVNSSKSTVDLGLGKKEICKGAEFVLG